MDYKRMCCILAVAFLFVAGVNIYQALIIDLQSETIKQLTGLDRLFISAPVSFESAYYLSPLIWQAPTPPGP